MLVQLFIQKIQLDIYCEYWLIVNLSAGRGLGSA